MIESHLKGTHEQISITAMSKKGTCGLANVGNTCYINTTIQCLGHCPSFLDYVLHGEYNREPGQFLTELYEVLKELWVNDNNVIPNRFLQHLCAQMKGFYVMEQNDIQEFFTLFVDKMNQGICTNITDRALVSLDSAPDDTTSNNGKYNKLCKKMEKAWIKSVGNEYSPIINFFYGQSIVQIVCGKCEKIHHCYEPFCNLLLPIIKSDGETGIDLLACLEHFVADEILNNNNDNHNWKCDGCQEQPLSYKTMKFWKLPKVLTICIKRFTYDLKKNNTPVKVPEHIDMTKHVLGHTSNDSKIYELCAIACHIGSFNHGHYYCVCKNPNGKWYKIDDTMVHELGDLEVPPTAYMLFYQLVA